MLLLRSTVRSRLKGSKVQNPDELSNLKWISYNPQRWKLIESYISPRKQIINFQLILTNRFHAKHQLGNRTFSISTYILTHRTLVNKLSTISSLNLNRNQGKGSKLPDQSNNLRKCLNPSRISKLASRRCTLITSTRNSRNALSDSKGLSKRAAQSLNKQNRLMLFRTYWVNGMAVARNSQRRILSSYFARCTPLRLSDCAETENLKAVTALARATCFFLVRSSISFGKLSKSASKLLINRHRYNFSFEMRIACRMFFSSKRPVGNEIRPSLSSPSNLII
jgi:hypothetical protein